MRKRREPTCLPQVIAISALVSVAGCSHYQETLREAPVQAATGSASLVDRFRAAFIMAYENGPLLTTSPSQGAAGVAGFGATGPSDRNSASAVAADTDYLNAGMSLVKANCLDYFANEGRLQQNVNVFKDLNNSFLPIASGAVAIAGSGGSAAGIIALVGAANNGVLNTVYTDFLFDASNIDDVRKLVMDAMSAHEVGVRTNMAAPGTTINFEWVTDQIRDHQDICEPAHILALARQAISNATLTAANANAATNQGAPVNTTPPGQPGSPPPAPKVDVNVATQDQLAALIPSDQLATIKAEAQAASRTRSSNPTALASVESFNKCLYPGMTHFGANHVPLDASGKAVLFDSDIAGKIKSWMKGQGIGNETLFEMANQPDQAAVRGAAVKLFCP